MKHAVIYARYSSDRQNEMSIEGQIAECRKYADSHNYIVIQEYIDRAQTATTDKRPSFLKMISDSESGTFDTILVYQLDRFARNKNDSGYYKKILADNGVKVVSAKEQIAEDSSGTITEGMLEIVADWFSKQLSEKVIRGMRQRAEQCKYNGGIVPFGFAVDEAKNYILDKEKSPIVQEIFQRVSAGETEKGIIDDLNKRGVKNARNTSFSKNSLQNILRNERYKGIYIYSDVRIPDGMPRIIDDDLFDEVQEILGSKQHHGHRPSTEDYMLTGKLYCGHCKELMKGTSGTSKTGKIHRYYMCTQAPRKCKKKNIRKEYLESMVIKICRELLTDGVIDNIMAEIEKQNLKDQESPTLLRLRDEIKSTKDKIEKLLDQIESGVSSSNIVERLAKREEELEDLKKQLLREEAKQKRIEPEHAKAFLLSLRTGDEDNLIYQKMLVQAFIDRIYLYDDHFHILFKYTNRKGKAGKQEVHQVEHYFKKNSSSASQAAIPI